MCRTIVALKPFKDGKTTLYLLQPSDALDAGLGHELECPPNSPPLVNMRANNLKPDMVAQTGKLLYDALTGQPAVREQLRQVLGNRNASCPLYLFLGSPPPESESLPWETLRSDNGTFLALNYRWPVARAVGSEAQINSPVYRPLAQKIRITAIFAAAQVDATNQWKAFHKALAACPVDVALDVYVCQQELNNLVKDDAAKNPGRISINMRYVPQHMRLGPMIAAQNSNPHIIHFFCHGSHDEELHLEVANLDDWLRGDGASSNFVVPDDFADVAGADPNLWLVTLNCCSGAASDAPADSPSMARQLVERNYTFAAVGMREPVAAVDADCFCESFYSTLFDSLKPAVKTPGKPCELEWSNLLYQPRLALRDLHGGGQPPTTAAGSTKEWTLPVLYSQPSVFMLAMVVPGIDEDAWVSAAFTLSGLVAARAALAQVPGNPPLAGIDEAIDSAYKQLFS